MKKLSYFLSILLIASSFASCGKGQKKEAEAAKPATEEAADPKLIAEGPYEKLIPATNTSPAYVLVNKPQADLGEFPKDDKGYITLFDGVSFKGWRGYNKDVVPALWTIEDGAMRMTGSGMGEAHATDGGDLIFNHKFKNFELTFDWKVGKGSNSGVFYLAQEVKGEQIWMTCPEYQVLDNENHIDATMGEDGNRQSASLYDMIPAKPQNSKAPGEWNTGTVIVYKGTVVHKQNGKNVLEYHLWTPKWTGMIAESKFTPGGEYPLAHDIMVNLGGADREGYIGLQDHGEDVWFKNVKIKILE